MWEGVKSALSNIAPVIGNALGGPLGATAMGYLTDVLGLRNPTPEQVEVAVQNATPEQRVALMDAQARLVTAIGNLKIQESQIQKEDLADARDMAENLSTSTNPKSWVILGIMLLIAISALGMFGMISVWAYWYDTAADAPDMRKLVLGTTIALLFAIGKFLWGKFKTQE